MILCDTMSMKKSFEWEWIVEFYWEAFWLLGTPSILVGHSHSPVLSKDIRVANVFSWVRTNGIRCTYFYCQIWSKLANYRQIYSRSLHFLSCESTKIFLHRSNNHRKWISRRPESCPTLSSSPAIVRGQQWALIFIRLTYPSSNG